MPAYIIKLQSYLCQRCGASAKYEVFNTYNASCGYFCGKCAHSKKKELDHGLHGSKMGSNQTNLGDSSLE